ncbi:MAG: hypothetical protein JNL26_12980 [Gemmatimonadetes bacterium]|nr:hypothetical protein [Gemmatimonadota bacterium]
MRRRCLAILLCLTAARSAHAQGVRVTGASWWQAIDLRPFRRDSVALSSTVPSGTVRRAPDGTVVSCPEGSAWCSYLRASDRQLSQPFLHDVSVAGWGLGQGVSVHAHGRARTALGGTESAWPRMNDRFDLLDAYVEVERPRGRVRLGRQWTLSDLGAYSYDGASLVLRRATLDGEVLAGQALVQGLNEPYTSEEIGQVDDLPPEQRAWMLGGRVRWRASSGAHALTGTYLRVLADDRSGLYAERASVDAVAGALGFRADGNLAVDVASGELNEARVRLSRRMRAFDVSVDARHHQPFFELWTIWGAFAPVGFDELRATTAWARADGALGTTVSAARRSYRDPGTGLQSVELRTDGWRLGAEASWTPDAPWSVIGAYGIDVGVGASQSDGTMSVTRRLGEAASFGATLSARQTIYEYRVGTGRVLGAMAHAEWRVRGDLRARAEAGQYQHRLTNDAPGPDWSQRRASVRLEWAVGGDPGSGR